MTRLEELYNSIETLRKLGVPINKEQLETVDKFEEDLITEEILPAISKSVAPILNNLRRNLTLVIDYDPEKGITVNTTREHVIVKERAAKRYDLPSIPRIKYSLVAEQDIDLLPKGAIEILMHKDLDWSLFNHGLTIPQVFHYSVSEAYGKTLRETDNVDIEVIIDGMEYKARLYSLRRNNGARVMQLLWTPNSPIAHKLQSMLPEQFEYMKDRREHIDIRHEHVKLPIEMQREFFLCKTAINGTYLLHLNGDYTPKIDKSNVQQEDTIEEDAPIVCSKKCSSFVFDVMKYFEEQYGLESIIPYLSKKKLWGIKKQDEFSLAGFFFHGTTEELKQRNNASSYTNGNPYKKWFEEPFKVGDDTVYLSNQWRDDDKNGLSINSFEKMIQTCFDEEYCIERDSSNGYELKVN